MTLWEAFSTIKDFRSPANRWYDLASVLAVYVISLLSGSTSTRGCAQFCERHREALTERFGWHSTPSFSTLSLLLRRTCRAELQSAFGRWMQAHGLQGETLCVDGKALRGTMSDPHGTLQHYAHTVQLYGQQSAQVLACADGKDEVAALLALVAGLPRDVFHTVTADALYARAEVTTALYERGHHYMLCVKANQPRLLGAIEAHARARPSVACFEQTERNRGRRERRKLELWRADFAHDAAWKGIATVLRIERERNGKAEITFYISSWPPQAPPERFAEVIRAHWHIENKFHYVKDTVLREDASRIRAGHAPFNAAVLRNAAFNLLTRQMTNGITCAIRNIAHDIKCLLNIPSLLNRA
jgi:predicted transposase YbfD/YdcC